LAASTPGNETDISDHRKEPAMMDGGMMDRMGGMMLGMGVVWLLLLAVLVLGAAALVKYLFFSGRK
jgi:hypothetical protein